MKLHYGDLYWDETRSDADYLTMDKDIHTDIAIIGGGMSGAMLAFYLTEAKFDVCVFDQGVPGYGSSDGNTGIIQFSSDKPLDDMIRDFGDQYAVDFYRLCEDAMKELGRVAHTIATDVGYTPTHSLQLAKTREDIPVLKASCATLQAYDFLAEWVPQEKLDADFGLQAFGALRTGNDAGINPFKMVQCLHQWTMAHGNRVFKETKIVDISEGEGFTLTTQHPYTVHAKRIIIAMGYAKGAYPPVESEMERNTTYSMITEPIQHPLWAREDMIWDSNDPYLYCRKNEQGRLIAGGYDEEGEEFSSEAEILKRAQDILKDIQAYYPPLQTRVTHAWQSIFGESKDGLPFIGQDAKNENKYFALGFGGNGTCYCVAAALIIRAFLQGEAHPYAYTTAFPRTYERKSNQ